MERKPFGAESITLSILRETVKFQILVGACVILTFWKLKWQYEHGSSTTTISNSLNSLKLKVNKKQADRRGNTEICTDILILFCDWIRSYDTRSLSPDNVFAKFYFWKFLSGKIVARNDRKCAPISIKWHEMGSTHQKTRNRRSVRMQMRTVTSDSVRIRYTVYYLSFCYLAIICELCRLQPVDGAAKRKAEKNRKSQMDIWFMF